MFHAYDDHDYCYELIYPDGRKVSKTAQGLSEFFVFSEHGLGYDFEEFMNKLDKGYVVSAEDNAYDYGSQSYRYQGNILINKKKQTKSEAPPEHKHLDCKHTDKYVNSAGGVKFYVCPKCKQDLGDA
jgi:hypothetical protein